MNIDFEKYDGFVYDLDGTLADTMPVHLHAWTATLEKHSGKPSLFTEEQFYAKGGVPAREIVVWLNEQYGYNLPIAETVHEKEELFLKFLGEVQPIVPVIEIVKKLGKNRKMAVASGGLTPIVRYTVEKLGLLDYFQALVGSDQVSRGKPSPEIFLKAAKELGVDPKKCLAFEDGEPGLASARAAGMDVLDVKPLYCQDRSWYKKALASG
jgi:HAD superfamily hydrolase (TIGR01509 family)